jgi:hypothetical protein
VLLCHKDHPLAALGTMSWPKSMEQRCWFGPGFPSYGAFRLGRSVGRNCEFGSLRVAETAGQMSQAGHRTSDLFSCSSRVEVGHGSLAPRWP